MGIFEKRNRLLRIEKLDTGIDRVFNFNNAITNFQGDVTFFYEDSELVGSFADQSTIVLRVKDGATWGSDLIPIRNGGLNTLTYNFPTSTNFSSITASKPSITLSISKFNELNIAKISPTDVS